MKKYYLYLEPFTFIFLQKEEILIFNSISNKGQVFKNEGILGSLLTELNDFRNMYCLEIKNKILIDKGVQDFIKFLKKTFSGDLIVNTTKKPIIFPPKAKIQFDINNLQNSTFRNISEEIYKLLTEVSIYLGGPNPSTKFSNLEINKQFDYPIISNGKYVKSKNLQNIVNSLKFASIQNMNLIGGNIFSYPDLFPLINMISLISGKKTLFSVYSDVPLNLDIYTFLKNPQFELRILIEFPIDLNAFVRTLNVLLNSSISYEILFVITSIEELNMAEEIILKYNLNKTNFKSLYTGENHDFFKKYVYLNEEDIMSLPMSKKDIFINQNLNVFYFGKIKIFFDGKIYSSFSSNSSGDIKSSLNQILIDEMSNSRPWLKVRNTEPCNQCIYQWLCPPPNPYEEAIGKPNLCLVK